MLAKPEIGERCNGCGLCCRTVVCSIGSFALGMVDRYGERAPGPCPALQAEGDAWTCEIVKRPKDFLPGNPNGVMPLRSAISLLIGAGMGCDEAGDEDEASAGPKLLALQERFLQHHSRAEINHAFRVLTK